MVRAIVGANWGDEGKGKITDLFAGQSDIVIRFQGGANAGHTIINEHGRFAFHLMPSGVFSPEYPPATGRADLWAAASDRVGASPCPPAPP